MILLTCALLATGEAGAAGRESGRKTTAPATETSGAWRQDLETWLARLQGSFAIKVTIEEKIGNCRAYGAGQQKCDVRKAATYVSAANCQRIGEGPGLHCTFDELQHEASAKGAGDVGAPALFWSNGLPTRMLLGIDPVARKIRVMLMDGAAGYDATGSLLGNTVALKGRCELAESKRAYPCTWTLSIQASPDGRTILLTRARQNLSGVSSSLFDGYEPHTFELSRVEQPAQPRN
ncbi:MAG: hypothetical protein ABI645_08900 [Pseudomonadota bacterium]